jgi:hypothetical protein
MMTTTTQHRRLAGWLLFAGCTLGLLMTLTFCTQAQTTTPKKGKQGTTLPREQASAANTESHANGRAVEMDGVSRAELEKAQLELERAQAKMSKQDWKKIESEMAQAKVEMEKVMKASQAAFEMEGMQKAMAEMEKTLTKQQEKIANEMKKADFQLKKAQEQLNLMQQGMELMEKDGLLKAGESINIGWDEEIMILNGKKQSKEVSEKYRKYFKHEKHRGSGKASTVI